MAGVMPFRVLATRAGRFNYVMAQEAGYWLGCVLGLQTQSLSGHQSLHTGCYADQTSNATVVAPCVAEGAQNQQAIKIPHDRRPHAAALVGIQGLRMSELCPASSRTGAFHAVVAAAADPDVPAIEAGATYLLNLLQDLISSAQNQQAVQQLERRLLQAMQELAGAVVPLQQLLPLLDASAQLQQVPQQLMSIITNSVIQHIPQLTPVQLAVVLTALSTCHTNSHSRNVSSSRDAGKPFTKQATLQKAISRYLQKQQHAFDAASTAAVAVALARGSYGGNSFSLLSMLLMDHIQDMSPQQLTDVLCACAAVQHYNQAVVDAATKLAVQTLKRKGYRLQQQQQDVKAVQQHGHDQQQEGQERHTRVEAGFTCDNFVHFLQACSQLRHHSAELLDCAAMATLRSLSSMHLHQVTAVVSACAQLNHYNMPLFEEACRLAQQVIMQQQQGQQPAANSSGLSRQALAGVLTNLAWSCAIMNHMDPVFFNVMATWATKSLQVHQLSQEQLLQWFQVQSCCVDAAVQVPELRSIGLPNQLLLAAQTAWMQQQGGQQRLTNFHKEVHAALRQAGRRSRLNVALDGPLVVDVALVQQLSRSKVAIQLEMPDMFAANAPHAALGPTAARWRALQARGWQVLSLRYSDWCRLKTPEDKTRHMWHLKEASVTRTPLAPDVVQAIGSEAAAGGKQGQQSLTKQLWRLLVD